MKASIPDNALPSKLYEIHTGGPFARIQAIADITRDGVATRYDFEGIVVDTSRRAPRWGLTFWTASEGNAVDTTNKLLQINRRGDVLDEITLPPGVDSAPYAVNGKITSNGFEGVAVSGDGQHLLAAIQRPYRGETAVGGVLHTRIARYNLKTDSWEAFFYPLQPQPAGDAPTIGLSEITLVGKARSGADVYAVIERDNRETDRARLKRIYTFTLEGLNSVDIEATAAGGVNPSTTIVKTLRIDLAPVYAPYEKIEGLTRTPAGDAWVVLDNDGGESASPLIRFRGLFQASGRDGRDRDDDDWGRRD